MLRTSFIFCRNAVKMSNNLVYSKNPVSRCIAPVFTNATRIDLSKYSTNTTDTTQNRAVKDEHIYTGLISKQVIAVKIFSLSSSVVGLSLQPIMYQKCVELGNSLVVMGTAAFIGFFTFVTPLLLHFITKKYVTDIEYNPVTKIYTATLYTFFVRKKKIQFTPDDVEVPDLLGMFTSMHIKGTPVFIELSHFKDPNHYAKIMGYDKPINFAIETEPQESTKKT